MIQEEIIRQMAMIQEEKDVKSGPQKLGEGALVLFVCEINFASTMFFGSDLHTQKWSEKFCCWLKQRRKKTEIRTLLRRTFVNAEANKKNRSLIYVLLQDTNNQSVFFAL